MKNIILYTFLFACFFSAQAQVKPDSFSPAVWMQLRDSNNPVFLNEIRIRPNEKGPKNQLVPRKTQDVEEYIKHAPSLTLISRGAFGKEPVLRGMNTDRLQITVDGMPVANACVGKMDPASSYVESNNLDKIEVQSSGEELMNTSSAGGNLNLRTLDPVIGIKKKSSGEAGLTLQSNGFGRNAFLKWQHSEQDWGLLFNATAKGRDDYRDGKGNLIENSQYHKANVAVSAKWRPSPRNFVDADLIIDEAWNVGYPALPMDVPRASARMAKLEWKQYKQDSKLLEKKWALFANRVIHNMNNLTRKDGIMKMEMPGQTSVAGVSGAWKWQRRKNSIVDFRLESMRKTAFASMTMYPENEKSMYMLTWPDINVWSGSIFLKQEIKFDRFEISNSLRVEGIQSKSQDENGIRQWQALGKDVGEPDHRLSGGWSLVVKSKLISTLSGQLSASGNMRAPTVTEQYGLYIYNASDGFVYLGNPQIKNEKSIQVIGSFDFQRKKINVRSEVYAYRFFDYILAAVDTNLQALNTLQNGVKVYNNTKGAHLLGGNVQFSAQLHKKIELQASLDYVEGWDLTGQYLPFIPPFNGWIQLSYAPYRWGFYLEAQGALAQNKVSIYAGEDATPPYAVITLSAERNFTFSKYEGKIVLSAENLTNSYYWDHLDWNNVPRPGRSFLLSFAVNF